MGEAEDTRLKTKPKPKTQKYFVKISGCASIATVGS